MIFVLVNVLLCIELKKDLKVYITLYFACTLILRFWGAPNFQLFLVSLDRVLIWHMVLVASFVIFIVIHIVLGFLPFAPFVVIFQYTFLFYRNIWLYEATSSPFKSFSLCHIIFEDYDRILLVLVIKC